MVLVFILVLVFIWGYQKIFPRGNKLKMIVGVTVFSVLASFLVSFLSLYGIYGAYDADNIELVLRRYNPALAQLSLPFYLELGGYSLPLSPPHKLFVRIFFVDVEIWKREFGLTGNWPARYIYPPGQPATNYTNLLFYQLLLIFTAINIIGAPLAAFTYKVTEKTMEKVRVHTRM